MKNIRTNFIIALVILILQSCAIIHPGEVALDVHLGKIKRVLGPGNYHTPTFGRQIIRYNARIQEYDGKFNFHSMEGIEINSELTLTYHLVPDSLKSIYKNFGLDYKEIVIIDNLTKVMRVEGANYKATELLEIRTKLEESIKADMNELIRPYGFEVNLVLLKHLELPQQVISTIEAKLNSETLSKKTEIDLEIKRKNRDYDLETEKKQAELEIAKQRLILDFAIEKQKKEAERMQIEAIAIKKQQATLDSTLTTNLLKLKSLEITRDLLKSNNTKIIITDGKSPVILDDK